MFQIDKKHVRSTIGQLCPSLKDAKFMQKLILWYKNQTESKELNYDQAQYNLIKELDKFLGNFASLNFITRLFRNDHKLGYYIYGGVGRGKSMIMNAMFDHTNTTRKTRKHFHEFMQDIHSQLANLSNVDDPLAIIAKKLKSDYDIIYLDEMHVSDIATAMIMKRLLESIFANKIYIVTSSNYHPDGLWPNGLMRERFLPAIEVLKEFLNIQSLEADQDYRLFNDSVNKLFIMNDTDALNKLDKIFDKINNNKPSTANNKIEVCNRNISYIKQGKDVIWFDFNVICGDMRSQLDYLELIKKFEWFIISDICLLTVDKKDVARRFTWLIDILYDSNRKLAISTAVPFKDIYSRGDFANEFERTISRLEEMQTQEYLEKDLTDKAG